jgi:hypothetical protein
MPDSCLLIMPGPGCQARAGVSLAHRSHRGAAGPRARPFAGVPLRQVLRPARRPRAAPAGECDLLLFVHVLCSCNCRARGLLVTHVCVLWCLGAWQAKAAYEVLDGGPFEADITAVGPGATQLCVYSDHCTHATTGQQGPGIMCGVVWCGVCVVMQVTRSPSAPP